jgi:hypothetical protein
MPAPRLATYSIDGATRYGVVTDNGIVDLSSRFAKDYPTLREAIAAGALTKLVEDAAKRSPDHALDAVAWQPPIPAPDKIEIPEHVPAGAALVRRPQHAGGAAAGLAAARL